MNSNTKRPIIGIITASACLSEQRQLLDGIIGQAQKFGSDTAIFSNIYNSSEYYANIDEENKIYDLIASNKLDGLILTAESILNESLQKDIYQRIVSRDDIPIVVTGAQLPSFPCINNDVESDLKSITDHLIECHKFTEIDILTGPADIQTSLERINGYKKSLISHDIPFDESRIIYGDFWMNSGNALAMEYISGNRRFPQAVVCSNDYMAYGLCHTLIQNGILIPKDITVIGYEYVGERFYHIPILTTFQRNRRAVGASAVNKLWSLMKNTKTVPISTSGFLVPGNSCFCGVDEQQMLSELTAIRREQYYSQLNLTGNFEQQLTLCSSIQDYICTLQEFVYLVRDVIGVYLCLHENWCKSQITSVSSDLWDTELMICYRIICPESEKSGKSEALFHKNELYPDIMIDTKKGSALYFCPIFFSGHTLGYFILQYDHPDCYDMIFRDWLKNASNALEMLRMKNDINTLLACRELSALHDSVTGLYNENGIIHELKLAALNSEPKDNVVLILIRSSILTDKITLKNKKNYLCIEKNIAENLQKISSGKKEFCAKINDSLYAFAVVGTYSKDNEAFLADKIKTIILQPLLHYKNSTLDSLVIGSFHENIRNFNFKNAVLSIKKEMQQKINEISYKKKKNGYDNFLKLRNQIYLEPQNKWDVQKLCCDFCLSCGRFRAAYKNFFGISFHKDLIESRILLAKYLLITTKMNISSISARCGYDDDKHFMHQFKQFIGITPNMYRKNDMPESFLYNTEKQTGEN